MRRSRSDDGASLVEFALILPVLGLLLLGTITGALTLSRYNSVENSVREATRFGAVNPLGTPPNVNTYLSEVLDQAIAGATGDLDDGVDGRIVCVAFVDASGTITSLTENVAGVRSPGASLCFADGRSDERVQVRAERKSEIEAILYNQNLTLRSESVTRYER